MAADPAELMNAAERADVRPVFDHNMAGETDAVAEDNVVADAHIVGDVGVSHQQVFAADRGYQTTALSAAMYGDKFPDVIAVADACFGVLAAVFLVLRGYAHGAVREEEIVGADRGRALEVGMGHQARPGTDLDLGAHDAVRSYLSG